ncbi:hypothetical protein IGI04_030058, partial [Brassica rapa subsp. trilocularis]
HLRNDCINVSSKLELDQPVPKPGRYIATCQASKRSSFAFSFECSSKRFSPPTRYIATCQALKRSSFAFSFESRSKRFWFRLNQSFCLDFTTKTSKTRLNSLACSYSPLPPSLRSPSNLDRNVSCVVSIGVTIETLR